jgi:hypothetical protein
MVELVSKSSLNGYGEGGGGGTACVLIDTINNVVRKSRILFITIILILCIGNKFNL